MNCPFNLVCLYHIFSELNHLYRLIEGQMKDQRRCWSVVVVSLSEEGKKDFSFHLNKCTEREISVTFANRNVLSAISEWNWWCHVKITCSTGKQLKSFATRGIQSLRGRKSNGNFFKHRERDREKRKITRRQAR